MPIALFPELAQALSETARRLALWERLAPLEEQLLRRARGAFLVRWFGPLVPEYRLNLFIAIANIGELQARLAQARASMPGPESEMNLLRPLSAMAGTLLGAGMSLSGSFLIAPYLHELLDLLTTAWWSDVPKLFYTLVLNWIMPAFGPGAMVFIGMPMLVGLSIGNALAGNRTLRAGYGFLGDLAMMLDAFLRFWDQLTGPVEQIRNPVLHGLVTLMHRIAHLFAQVLGFVSLIVVRVLPLVPSLLEQWRAIKALGVETMTVATEALSTLADDVLAPFGRGPITDMLIGLFAALMALPGRIVEGVTFLVDAAKTELGYALSAINDRLSAFVTGLTDRIVAAFNATPVGLLVGRLTALLAMLPDIRVAFAGIGAGVPTSSESGGASTAARVEETLRSFGAAAGLGLLDELAEALPGERAGKAVGTHVGGAIADVIGAARRLSLPAQPAITLPDFPALPTLPDTPALHSRIGAPAPRDLGHDAAELLRAAQESERARRLPAALTRRPRSAFAALLAENAVPSAPTAAQLALRDAIYGAVGRVLPASLRLHAPRLREAFDRIDRDVYAVDPTAGPLPEHPQLDLPDSGLLRPVIEMLTIRARDGAYAPDLRAFRDMVMASLRAETYRVADAAPAGG